MHIFHKWLKGKTKIYRYHFYAELFTNNVAHSSVDGILTDSKPIRTFADYANIKDHIGEKFNVPCDNVVIKSLSLLEVTDESM